MNRKFALKLLSSPVLFASMISMVVMTHPARASENNLNGTHLACVDSPHTATRKLVCERVANNPTVSKTTVEFKQANVAPTGDELEFSDQESEEAIKLFGCDCVVCINAVRQLHGAAQIPV